MQADVAIVGAGPSGIFTALRLIRERPQLHIVMVEKGLPIAKALMPKARAWPLRSVQPRAA